MTTDRLMELRVKMMEMNNFWLSEDFDKLPENLQEEVSKVLELQKDLSSVIFSLKAKDMALSEATFLELLKEGWHVKTGDLVKIRPIGDWAEGKTYLGFYLGDAATSAGLKMEDDVIKCYIGARNPAIFIPEVKKIVYGYESWWGRIKSTDEVKEITDDDIDNIWYVKALKALKGDDNADK